MCKYEYIHAHMKHMPGNQNTYMVYETDLETHTHTFPLSSPPSLSLPPLSHEYEDVHILHIHTIYTAYTHFIHCIRTLCILQIYCTLCVQHIYCIYTPQLCLPHALYTAYIHLKFLCKILHFLLFLVIKMSRSHPPRALGFSPLSVCNLIFELFHLSI